MQICCGICLLFLLAGLQTPSPPDSPPKPETYLDPEAYVVYGAVLPENWAFGNWFRRADALIIEQETQKDGRLPGCLPSVTGPREAWRDALESYKKENQSPKLLARQFPIDKHYELVPGSVIAEAFKGKGWNGFYERYPHSEGIINLSAVGFNSDRTKALVFVVHYCGNTCGSQSYIFLEKKSDKWTTVTFTDFGNHSCFAIF